MNKPYGYDDVTAFGEYEPLQLGGHICRIMEVKEELSSNKKDMLVISLDIAEGAQKGYYANRYKNDTKSNKKWGCVVYQMVFDNSGMANPGLKTFLNCIEKSNSGYHVVWGDQFCSSLKGKLIGGVFGREQYLNQNNELKFITKCRFFKTLEDVKNGIDPPEDKLLANNTSSSAYTPQSGYTSPQTYTTAPTADYDLIDDDLPF